MCVSHIVKPSVSLFVYICFLLVCILAIRIEMRKVNELVV